MNYTYELVTQVETNDAPVRKEVTTRFEEVKESDCIAPNYVIVSNNLNTSAPEVLLKTSDDYLGWNEMLARSIWIGNRTRAAENALHSLPRAGIPTESVEQLLTELANTKLPEVKLPDNNLKTAAAAGKPIISSIPPIALFAMGAAMADGVKKYGRFNWRTSAVTSSVFYDAMHRHLAAWYSGEDFAPDSNIHHLAHVMASCAILFDAELHKVLNDDRDLEGHKVTPDEMSLIKKVG